MATSTSEQIVREAPNIEAYKLGLLKSAKSLSDKKVNLPDNQIAEMSGMQNAAYGLAGQGIGNYLPYLNQAGYSLGDAQYALGQVGSMAAPYQQSAANMYGAGISNLDPRAAQAYFNPYENAAVQQTMSDIGRQGEMQQQNLSSQAVKAGAFGGSRQGIEAQELNRNVMDQQARTAAQMRQSGYESAGARALQAAQQYGQMGEGMAGLGLNYGQLGLQQGDALGQLGLRQASLGQSAQSLGQGETGFLFDMGKTQQAQQQAELQAKYNSQMAQAYEPYQRLGFLSDIYKGAPSSQMSVSAASTPNVSPAQQYLGLGIAGLSAATGAQKAGLF